MYYSNENKKRKTVIFLRKEQIGITNKSFKEQKDIFWLPLLEAFGFSKSETAKLGRFVTR